MPGDETGDCHVFTTKLAEMAQARHVQFLFNRSIDGLVVEGDTLKGVHSDGETLTADACV